MKRVVITGMGAITPLGNDLETTWNAMLGGLSGAGPITKFDASRFKTRFACELHDFDPAEHFTGQEIKRYDPFTLYALKAVNDCINHSNLDLSATDLHRVGVVWGSGNGGVMTNDQQMLEFAGGGGVPRFSPFYIPRILVDIVAGVISMKYGLLGPNFSTISACASSTSALIEASHLIKLGKADMVISGGSEAPITSSTIGGFNALKALSTRNDAPGEASRPFDKTRDGFVMGEGAAALILESLEHARRRGATIFAEIAGGGMTADAYHLTATHPEGDGAMRAMIEAITETGISPAKVDHVNAHATSTMAGDRSEWIALERVFKGSEEVLVTATKSMTGHLLGAAGAVEAVAAVMALHQGIVPPTINVTDLDVQESNIRLVRDKPVKKNISYAMSNTFGFGGHIASILLKRDID